MIALENDWMGALPSIRVKTSGRSDAPQAPGDPRASPSLIGGEVSNLEAMKALGTAIGAAIVGATLAGVLVVL